MYLFGRDLKQDSISGTLTQSVHPQNLISDSGQAAWASTFPGQKSTQAGDFFLLGALRVLWQSVAMINRPLIKFALLFSLAVNLAGCDTKEPAVPGTATTDTKPITVAASPAFNAASGVEETRHQLARIRKDDMWWKVSGEDLGWNHRNVNRFMPTVTVYRNGPVRLLEEAPNPVIPAYPVETPDGPMPFGDFLSSDFTRTMGVVILAKGKLVFEAYPRQEPHEKPIYWSVTKALVGTVISILEDRGLVDTNLPVETYISRLKGSSYEGISIRNILDMASGIECEDEYEDTTTCYNRYAQAIGDAYFESTSPDDPYEFMATTRFDKFAEPGETFQYSGANTFLMQWLVEEITGDPFQDVLTREIWWKMGAEADAALMAPRYGVPIAHGGLLAPLRDVARFGLLFTPSYKVVSDEKIVSDRFIDLLLTKGNPKLYERAHAAGYLNEVKWPAYQWDEVYDNNDIFKGGWAGQGLLVNPTRDIVAVYTGYLKEDESELNFLARLRAVLNGVYGATD